MPRRTPAPNLRVLSNLRKPETVRYGYPATKCGPFALSRVIADNDDGWEYYVHIDRPRKPKRVLGPCSESVARKRFMRLIQIHDRNPNKYMAA